MGDDVWELLGMEPTTDERSIKKAYAARVKTCHMEDAPEEWKRLHDAYKEALSKAKRAGGALRRGDEDNTQNTWNHTPGVSFWQQDDSDKAAVAGPDQEQVTDPQHKLTDPVYDFSDIQADASLPESMNDELRIQIRQQLAALAAVSAKKKNPLRKTKRAWEDFLSACESGMAFGEPFFWNEFHLLLEQVRMKYGMYVYLKKRLDKIQGQLRVMDISESGPETARVVSDCCRLCQRRMQNRRAEWIVWGIFASLCVLMVCSLFKQW